MQKHTKAMYFAKQEYPLINGGAAIYIYTHIYMVKRFQALILKNNQQISTTYTQNKNETSFNTLFLKLKKQMNRYVSELLLTLKQEAEEKDSAKRLSSLQNQKKEN